jgi:transposase
MGNLFSFERGQIVSVCLVGASVIKTATLLGVPGATVSKVTSAYTNHGKATSAKRNSGQKSTLTERDHCILRRIV